MKTALDLAKHAWVKSHGDLTVYGTWYQSEEEAQPCLVVVRTSTGSEDIRPCIVLLENVWAWSEEQGDPRHIARAGYEFAEALGLDPLNPRNIDRIVSLIREYLSDLIAMPPMPRG